MPPLYDAMDVANALRNEALPALQRFANHSNLRDRDLRRFEDDEPPPYESSTDDTEDEAPCQVPIGELTPADQDLFDAPLTDQERSDVAYSMYRFHYAIERFREEEEVQRRRINDWASNHHNPDVRRLLSPLGFGEKIQLGERRCAVVARHIVKRRWQKLGVWNPDWGIPEPGWYNGPKVPNRNYSIDRWPWQHNEVPTPDMQSRQKDLVHRAVELRQGLRHGEHAPVPPRSHLTPSSSDAQAESFLTSRPWFQLELEQMERGYRERRLPVRDRQKQKRKHDTDTTQLWKDRGDWQDKWHDSDGHVLVGWKWRHESPSPEPEDLAGVEDMAGLELELELTPSESCALEGIPDPPPTPPRVFIHDPMVELRGGVLFPTRPMPSSVPEQTVRVPADRPDRPDNDAVDHQPVAEEDRPLQSPPSPPSRTSAALMPAQPFLRRSARIAAMAAKHQPPVPPQPRQTKQTRQTRTRRLPVQKKEKASAGVTKRKNPSNRPGRSRQ